MPDPVSTLDSLRQTADSFLWLAALWHAVVLIGAIAFASGWRPTVLDASQLLVLPVLSVAFTAAMVLHVLTLGVFFLIALALIFYGLRLKDPLARVTATGRPSNLLGVVLLLLAWGYPGFLDGHAPQWALVAAPMGVLPAPTLLLLLGCSALLSSFGSRSWSVVVGGAAVVYGLVGWLYLGVWLDAALVLGGIAVMAQAVASAARFDGAYRSQRSGGSA